MSTFHKKKNKLNVNFEYNIPDISFVQKYRNTTANNSMSFDKI